MLNRSTSRSSLEVLTFLACASFCLAQVTMQPLNGQSGNLETWRKRLVRSPLPKHGCFHASYPITEWQEVACVTSPQVPVGPARGAKPATVGNGFDFAAQSSGLIYEAEGLFTGVNGVTSESDSLYGANTFSLQVNTNLFQTAACAGHSGCFGWEQFLYDNYPAGQFFSGIFIQYWLIGWGTQACPPSWISSENNCYFNGNGVAVSPLPITDLAGLALIGMAESGTDTVYLLGATAGEITASTQDSVLNLEQGWNTAEFNVFGGGNLSVANFNSGSTLVVQTSIEDGTTNAPSCIFHGTTGEQNNFNLVAPCLSISGSLPAIEFMESNAGSATPPTVTTGTASYVTSNTAVLNGTINPNGSETLVWFEYNTSSSAMNCSSAPVLSGPAEIPSAGTTNVIESLSGLNSATTYYFVECALYPGGNLRSGVSSFTTAAVPITTVSLSPSSLIFSNQTLGTSSSAQTVTLTNTGNTLVSISLISISGDFSQTNSCGSVQGVGASCQISVTFTPIASGSRSGTLLVSDNAANSPQTVSLSGTGSSVRLVNDLMTETTPSGNACAVTTATSSFLTTDSQAVVWFEVNNASAGDQLVANWYRPNGSLYETYSWTPLSNSGSWCLWAWIDIAGNPPASDLGTWSVFVSYNGSAMFSLSFTIQASTSGLRFVPLSPCRVVDTRDASKPVEFGPPFITGGASRSFAIPNGPCAGIPASAQAYSLNVTVVPHSTLGYLTVWPTGQSQPLASSLNSLDGRIKANAAIVPAGTGQSINVYATNTTDVVLDINGYFVPASNANALAFYPMTPCRLVDTRAGAPQTIISGELAAGSHTTLPILLSGCNVPSSAQAYSLNFTLVPPGPVAYLTVYPTGEGLPVVSTLNDATGMIEANAAIASAGSGGAINVYVTNATNLVVDINGYFAPVGTGALSLYALPPCRVLDTRNPQGSPPFEGTNNVNVVGSGCGGTSAAQAYVFNATVVPDGPLGYLTLWPQGSVQPVVSTLNALDGSITSNMAIVPTSNTEISAFATNSTYLVLDLFGYFAP